MSLAVMNSSNEQQVNNRNQGHELSSSGGKRKLSAYHPTLGYAIPPPQPAKVARRNARERNRVKQVNCGFEVLRTHIPTAVKHKKMSKVDTLRHAVDYIQNLKQLLGEQDDFLGGSSADDEPKSESPDVKRSPLSSIPTPPEQVSPSTTILPNGANHSSYYGGMASYSQYNSSQVHHQHHIPSHGHQHYNDYETSSYYSSSGVSPPPHGSTPYPPYSNSSLPPRDGSASPSSPSVYSDYGSCNQMVNGPTQTPSYMTNGATTTAATSLDDFYNAEEDEILDAIVKWQED